MGHLAARDAYKNLEDRINWFTQGAPSSETWYKILQVLYTEKEAKAEKLLDCLCEQALASKQFKSVWTSCCPCITISSKEL